MKITVTEYVKETFEIEIDDLSDDAGEGEIESAVEEMRVQHEGPRTIEVTDVEWERGDHA